MKNIQITLWVVAAFFVSSTTLAAPEGAGLSIVVQESEQQGEPPKPILELMILDGTQLEEATEVTVATSASGTYAQGFTYHAICMSTSEAQAERVHDIAIEAASDKYELGVTEEARFSLELFKNNGCVSDEERRVAITADSDSLRENPRTVALEPSEPIISGRVAGGASQSL